MPKLEREIIQPNSDRILPKVNQVIYTLDSICEPDIIILAQAALQILCWQGSIGLQYKSRKRGMIQLNNHTILLKVNQVIYFIYPNSKPDTVILAKTVHQMFCWQDCFIVQNAKVGKGR